MMDMVVVVDDGWIVRNAIDLLVAARDLGTGRTNWWRFYMGAGGSQMF
jgi:hypothetical protein